MEQYIRDTTGLVIDPYFSGTKMKWILENVPAARELADKGRLRFGTIDTWLVYSLTDGASYVTDATNASRTMLYDIRKLAWDRELLEWFDIPASMMPEVRPSGSHFGVTDRRCWAAEFPSPAWREISRRPCSASAAFRRAKEKILMGPDAFF